MAALRLRNPFSSWHLDRVFLRQLFQSESLRSRNTAIPQRIDSCRRWCALSLKGRSRDRVTAAAHQPSRA